MPLQSMRLAKHQIGFANDVKNKSLPAAFHHEAMHFSATEYEQAATENAYLMMKIYSFQRPRILQLSAVRNTIWEELNYDKNRVTPYFYSHSFVNEKW